MTKEQIRQQLENGKGTIYHELGHLIGYILSRNSEKSSLGEVLEFNIGFKKNCVTPKINNYHFKHPVEDQERIRLNTRNIPRTIAWTIEVILGCLLQSILEKRKFEDCYGLDNRKPGYHDCSNISAVNNLSHFPFDKDFFDNLKSEVESLIIDNNIIEKLKFHVNKIINVLIETEDTQYKYVDDELSKLTKTISEQFDEKMLNSYNQIIINNSEKLKILNPN